MSKREEIRDRRRREQRRRMLRLVTLIAVVALGVLILVVIQTQLSLRNIVMPDVYPYQNTDGRAIGDPDAPVVIELFSDFQCSACDLFHDETTQALIESYVDTGQVYLIYRNFPVIDQNTARKESHDAAMAAMCAAEQGMFWQYQDVLFENRTGENVGAFIPARLEKFAENLGLDMQQFNTCIDEERYQAEIDADLAEGLASNVSATPSLLINGTLYVGAYPLSDLSPIIEAQIQGR
ncbi:MAG: thioredoxin domain-containing protein [Anaerolineales bacterium]